MKSLPKELIEAYAGTCINGNYAWFTVCGGTESDDRIYYYLLGCSDDIEEPDNLNKSGLREKENSRLEQIRVVNCPYTPADDFSDENGYLCQRCSECIFII